MSTILFWMHLCTHSKIAILPQFLTSNVHFARKGSGGYLKIANVHFVREGCDWHLKSQFYFSFWRPTSISCDRVATDTSKSQFFFSFWRWTSISRERVVADTSQNRNFTSVLTFNVHFVRKGRGGYFKIAIFLQFWRPTSISCERVAAGHFKIVVFTLVFGRPMCTECCACHVSWRSGGTAPALRER